MTMRSAKVPLSPSSALQQMYFWSAPASWTVFHLMPVGKPAPPRPRRPDSVTSATMAAPAKAKRLRQALEAAVRHIVRNRNGIGDAAAREGEALLILQKGWSSMLPRRSLWAPPVEESA